jgi:hypothetical protein
LTARGASKTCRLSNLVEKTFTVRTIAHAADFRRRGGLAFRV